MSTYPTPHDNLTCPNAREVAALRKRVEELWFDLCEYQKHEQQLCPEEEGFVTYIPKLKARAEEAETGLARALPIWEEALKLARERAEQAELERDELMENHQALGREYEAQGRVADKLQADLDAALTLLGLSLREENGLTCFPGGPGSYDAQKRIQPLLEKRREKHGAS